MMEGLERVTEEHAIAIVLQKIIKGPHRHFLHLLKADRRIRTHALDDCGHITIRKRSASLKVVLEQLLVQFNQQIYLPGTSDYKKLG